jgi:N-acetylmuramoyl-L-alanine amidase
MAIISSFSKSTETKCVLVISGTGPEGHSGDKAPRQNPLAMPEGRSNLALSMVRPGHPLFFCAVLLFCAMARAGDWTVISYGGRDYVTMRNVADFYGLGDYRELSNVLTLGSPGRSLRGTVGSSELYIDGLKFILSYPISEAGGGEPIVSRMDLTKVIEPVLRPSRIRDAAVIDSVVLDPGHGGFDTGAMSIWGCEKTYALDVALRAKALLEAQGLTVYMTRTTDEFIPLEDRVRFANMHPTALFIAIHFNSGGEGASGIETYTLAPCGVPSMAADGPMLSDLRPNPGNVRDAENMALACATHASLICHSRMYDRGIKRARFVVIRDITIPGVLIEGGFLSNPGDAQLIATEQYRQEEAQCIAIAVRNYRNAVNPAPMLTGGRDVVVRDDAAGANPPPIGERPPGEPAGAPGAAPEIKLRPYAVAAAATPAPAAATRQQGPMRTAALAKPVAPFAPAAPKPAASPANQTATQKSEEAPREAGSRSIVTPIVD